MPAFGSTVAVTLILARADGGQTAASAANAGSVTLLNNKSKKTRQSNRDMTVPEIAG
jgi:hypothetical protein